jgi:hypothetical protein
VRIEANGIPIPAKSMDRNPSGMAPPGVSDGLSEEGRPLEVRGLLTQNTFAQTSIRQSSADAGATNVITLEFATNVPLTNNGATTRSPSPLNHKTPNPKT